MSAAACFLWVQEPARVPLLEVGSVQNPTGASQVPQIVISESKELGSHR